MKFGWINLFGFFVVAVMLIPNIFYAARFKDAENKCTNKWMNIIEQIGRYGSFLLMFIPLGVWKFGFSDISYFLVYMLADIILLGAYLIIWVFYFKKQSLNKALALAIIPTLIFFLSGILLRHWLLAISAVIFGIGHIYVTYANNKL